MYIIVKRDGLYMIRNKEKKYFLDGTYRKMKDIKEKIYDLKKEY